MEFPLISERGRRDDAHPEHNARVARGPCARSQRHRNVPRFVAHHEVAILHSANCEEALVVCDGIASSDFSTSSPVPMATQDHESPVEEHKRAMASEEAP